MERPFSRGKAFWTLTKASWVKAAARVQREDMEVEVLEVRVAPAAPEVVQAALDLAAAAVQGVPVVTAVREVPVPVVGTVPVVTADSFYTTIDSLNVFTRFYLNSI